MGVLERKLFIIMLRFTFQTDGFYPPLPLDVLFFSDLENILSFLFLFS